MKNKKEFFNNMAENWDKNDKVASNKYRRIIEELKIEDGLKILDIGTGTGVLIPYLLETGKIIEIYAIDYSEKMIEKFREKNFPENVKSFIMDIHNTDFENNFFDRIIANACYPHFEDKEKAIKEIYRILKKNGIFIISHPTGRKFVNELHKKTHPLIKKDIIPDIKKLKSFIEKASFKFGKGIDEEDFFLISFIK
ncbi:MAG TPA: class I SAM-dependent methyltransferase [bacterium]|nr:class I SAM-dependent methyltransferase [bacterium]HOM26767.1 class I SAM-dependent methyltransferase [bacterium]